MCMYIFDHVSIPRHGTADSLQMNCTTHRHSTIDCHDRRGTVRKHKATCSHDLHGSTQKTCKPFLTSTERNYVNIYQQHATPRNATHAMQRIAYSV